MGKEPDLILGYGADPRSSECFSHSGSDNSHLCWSQALTAGVPTPRARKALISTVRRLAEKFPWWVWV